MNTLVIIKPTFFTSRISEYDGSQFTITKDIMPMICLKSYFVIHFSTIFNIKVIVYRSELPFIYLRFIGQWVVTIFRLRYSSNLIDRFA